MFHPAVIARREAELTKAFATELRGATLTRHSLDECWARRDTLAAVLDDRGLPTRELTVAEQTFILHERLLMRCDYLYWSERWAIIAKETAEAAPLTPRWASQQLFLDQIAALELARQEQGHPDGLLFNVLKARQLGISTETEVILAHRIVAETAVRGMVAGDVESQSEYLFDMAMLVVRSLPWWMRPPIVSHRAGRIWESTTGSRLVTAWGRSARGGLQDREKAKGNIGRGRTYTVAHISELSTWERPEQLDDGFLPGVPRRPRVFVVFESTAKGRYDWWHQHWLQAERGVGRFTNVFIPWYIEPDKYWLPAPEAWVPKPSTLAHAEEVERDSPRWCLGRTIRLGKPQLYWYEHERARFDDDATGPEFTVEGRRVATFYEEYPASPSDAFQHAGQSIFGPTVLDRLKAQETRPVAIVFVEPAKDIAQLKAWEREVAHAAAQADE